jgi:calcium permeable stress-gated cation channel
LSHDHFVYFSFSAIGLQFGFRTLLWFSAVPPIFLILAFKIYINLTYLPAFKYFTPIEEEIGVAKVYSMLGDAQNHSLVKRFGHPALNTELFTPMLHKNMMPLLSEIYRGKINNDHAKLDEYGGQKMEAQVVPGGLKIAAIDTVCSRVFDTTLCINVSSFIGQRIGVGLRDFMISIKVSTARPIG